MTSTDTLRHFQFENSPVRGEIVHLDDSWRAVIAQRQYPLPVQHLLGELVVAAVLMSATMRLAGSLTMQIKSDGPLKLLVVDCKNGRSIRAMAHCDDDWQTDTPMLSPGKTQLVMTLDPVDGRERYQGIVELKHNSISRTLEEYLQQSGDVNARFWLANNSYQAAGMLLQRALDSDADDDAFWQQTLHTGRAITPSDLLDSSPIDLVSRLQGHYDVQLYDDETITFGCSCSRERVDRVLRWLGEDEIQDVIKSLGKVHVDCEFCGRGYEYDPVDVAQLFCSPVTLRSPAQRH